MVRTTTVPKATARRIAGLIVGAAVAAALLWPLWAHWTSVGETAWSRLVVHPSIPTDIATALGAGRPTDDVAATMETVGRILTYLGIGGVATGVTMFVAGIGGARFTTGLSLGLTALIGGMTFAAFLELRTVVVAERVQARLDRAVECGVLADAVADRPDDAVAAAALRAALTDPRSGICRSVVERRVTDRVSF